MKQPAYRSNEFQFFQGVGKFIFPSKFKWGSFFFDSRSKIDISETSLKLFLKRAYTSGNIFLLLATAQQTLLIVCSVGVSVVLRLYSNAIQEIECLKSPQFNLTLELIKSRWCSCLVHLQLTVEPNVIFLALAGDEPLNSWVCSIKERLRDVNVSQCIVRGEVLF